MSPPTATGRVDRLLRSALSATADDVIVVSDWSEVFRQSVCTVTDTNGDSPDHIRALGTEQALTEAFDDFYTATHAAELAENGRLSLHVSVQDQLPSLLVTPDRITMISALPGSGAVAVETDREESVDTIRSTFEQAFRSATPYDVTTPGCSRLLTSLERMVGSDVRADIAAVLHADVPLRSSRTAIDEIDALLLVGGYNGAQLFELSEWAEELDVASRATMSSRKRQLESAGLLTTEKIPADVGRPRQRLRIGPNRLREESPVELLHAASNVLCER